MDDLDRTFARLRRVNFDTLAGTLEREAGSTSFLLVNPHTFEMELAKPFWDICIRNGWTVTEFNQEFTRITYDKK